ncbi:MAG: precorrin-3B C(17)-methyltransferase [Myxococcota bacterium]
MSAGEGWVAVVGVGPGASGLVTPMVRSSLEAATDVVGYRTYVERLSLASTVTRHVSGNGDEAERARHALQLAQAGRRVAVVSSGDPGVFAMAAAVFEVLDADPSLRDVAVEVLPGITAMLAAAARVGAPLGHDFCAINLSCNLKPWALLERRIRAALDGDFAMALYNPRSVRRPDDLDQILELMRGRVEGSRPVIFARAVSTPDEFIRVVPLGEARGDMADMRTVVLVGSSRTRLVERSGGKPPYVYSPRSTPE